MKYFIDTEFNGFGGELISLAIVSEAGASVYLCLPENELDRLDIDPWVNRHVLPVVASPDALPECLPRADWARRLSSYFKGAQAIEFVADWPEDIQHLMQVLMIRPGEMIPLPDFSISCVRAVSWPNQLDGAVRHNALWDARALREVYLNPETTARLWG